MNKDFDDIIDKCLERITLHGESIENCLESYPLLSDQLEPLLRTALSTREAFSVEPRREFKQAAKARLLQAVEVKRELEEKRRVPLLNWQRRWAVALSLVLVLLIAGGSTVAASTGSLPGDTLYPVKTATEKVQAFFTFGEDAKANLYMKLAERRIEEINKLAELKRNIPPSVLQAMRQETDKAVVFMDKTETPEQKLVTRLVNLTANQRIVLYKVLKDASPEIKRRLQEELDNSNISYGKATVIKNRYRKPLLQQVVPRQFQSIQAEPNKKLAIN